MMPPEPVLFYPPLPGYAEHLTVEAWLSHRYEADLVLAELRCQQCSTLLSIECKPDRTATALGRAAIEAHFTMHQPGRFVVETDHEADDGRVTG
jgi:hypothetical protein